MTDDDFTTAARAYAEQACYQDENIPIAEAAFRAGWKAARSYLAAQEPTDGEVQAAAFAVMSLDGDRGLDGFTYSAIARTVLSAARATRRNEEKRDG